VLTGRKFHRCINPSGVDIQPGAFKVHGISSDFLQDKPAFAEVVGDLLDFIVESVLAMHNADFDIPFLDQEFSLLPDPPSALRGRVFRFVDTLELARLQFLGVSNSLNSLRSRCGIEGRGGVMVLLLMRLSWRKFVS
jgi:DNA polymerase III subunit epsilon